MMKDWRSITKKNCKILNEKQVKTTDLWMKQRWGAFFRISFIRLELLIETLYIYENRKEKPLELSLSDTLTHLEQKYKHNILDKREFDRWKKTRNDFIHHDKEIDQNLAKNAKIFFEKSEKAILTYLNKYIQPKKKYQGIALVENDYAIMKALEKALDTSIPHYPRFDFQDLVGFSARDGFVEVIALNIPNIKEKIESTPKPEFLHTIYIHGDIFIDLADWIRNVLHSREITKTKNIFIIDGEKWSRHIRPERFRRIAQIKQTNLRRIKATADIFLESRKRKIKKTILMAQNRYGRIYLDELQEILSMDKQLILEIIQELLSSKDIVGRFFKRTEALVFDLIK